VDKDLQEHIERARIVLRTAHHAAMATVNEDGSPHNTPYLFMYDEKLEHLYWGSHPDSIHSKNVIRTGKIFVVVYDMKERGGLYVKAEQAKVCEGLDLVAALEVHNVIRVREGKQPINREYYSGSSSQRMWSALPTNFWVNGAVRDEAGLVVQDIRTEITMRDLIS
jgi:hypothetical protein